MIAVLAGCAIVPMLVVGGPAYPVHWGNAVLVLMVCSTVAWSLRFAVRRVISLTDRLREEAVLDPLTGLLNRRGWKQTARAMLQRAQRTTEAVSLVAVDLDGFKTLNDQQGHDEGDRLLCEIADHIKGGLRGGDIREPPSPAHSPPGSLDLHYRYVCVPTDLPVPPRDDAHSGGTGFGVAQLGIRTPLMTWIRPLEARMLVLMICAWLT